MKKEPQSIEYIPGAFSCIFCQITFNYEIKMMRCALCGSNKSEDTAAYIIHQHVHQADFLSNIFEASKLRNAFYEYMKRKKMLSELAKI